MFSSKAYNIALLCYISDSIVYHVTFSGFTKRISKPDFQQLFPVYFMQSHILLLPCYVHNNRHMIICALVLHATVFISGEFDAFRLNRHMCASTYTYSMSLDVFINLLYAY